MCGICGIFDETSSPSVDTLEAMNRCLTHRGPDATGTLVDEPIGLGHRRLSIIDPTAGAQPLFNEDESIAVVFNGEIYNHRELRDSLRNHNFRTQTDTEVLVHLYEEHGPSFVNKLQGMFAFGLWDADTKRLILARDPIGIKPLTYASDNDRFAFGSELTALLESGVSLANLDETALCQYFTLGYIPAPRTIFENARKLPPGTMAIVSESGIQLRQFYSPSVESQRYASIDDAATELRKRVEDAVERRLMSDVPLGAFLSGGLDSSIIVGILAQLREEPVRTFTVGFEESTFDESWAARAIADFHDTDHHSYTVTPNDVMDAIPGALDRLGEPFADPSLIPTFVVASKTAEEVSVALSGDGADELFAGYEKYRGEYMSRYYRTLPRTLRRNVAEPLSGHLRVNRRNEVGEFLRKAREFLRGAGVEDLPARHVEWLRKVDDEAATAIDGDLYGEALETVRSWHEERPFASHGDDLSRMLGVDTRHPLPDQILRKTDLAGMYNSLEVRVPFLDMAVVEFAHSLPIRYKITLRTRKRILRKAFDDLLPPEIQKRGKQGFDMPVGEWFKGPLADEFEAVLEGIRWDGLDTDVVRQAHREHCRDRADYEKFLWSVYVFGRWERRYHEEYG